MISTGMRYTAGVRVAAVRQRTPAFMAGIRKNDRIVSANGHPVEDDLDFIFWTASETVAVTFLRKKQIRQTTIFRGPGDFLGVDLSFHRLRRCCNRCVFCFIDQMPSGLRKSLYIKDEDYRYSFLNGNYITLVSMGQRDLQRIVRLGLSPLYISVHATEPSVRSALLGNPDAGDILLQLRNLQKHGICFHTQIVVCPGINDGMVLKKTIRDLLSLKGVLSIAVVPVGLTSHRKKYLAPVTKENAVPVCAMVQEFSDADKKKTGNRRLFIADEFLVKADHPIPGTRYYEKYPQIENGVGLVRIVLDEWKGIKREKSVFKNFTPESKEKKGKKHALLVLTSVSAHRYIEQICEELSSAGSMSELVVAPVVNRFFGESVTVAGLLAASDIIRTAKQFLSSVDAVIIPAMLFNSRGYTLDGYSRERMAKIIGIPVIPVHTIHELTEKVLHSKRGKSRSNG